MSIQDIEALQLYDKPDEDTEDEEEETKYD